MRLVIDFNSYFASVEQQLNPDLRGRPVAVVPMLADTTCCIAASYEAKKKGVKTGTLVKEARQLCPEIIFVTGDHSRYVEIHHQLIAAIDSVCQVVAVTSIDEMHCDLNARDATPEKAMAVARRIKQAIYTQVGLYLRCSIGIAPNSFLAKTASDMQKPDGLTLLEMKDLPHALYRLELRDLCGIGPRMEERLLAHGIETVEQLCTASKPQLRKAWGGVQGEIMWARLRGEEPPTRASEPRTIGHSHVLSPEMRNDRDAHAVIHRMLQKAAMRLRKAEFTTSQMSIFIKLSNEGLWRNKSGWSHEGRFNETQDSLELGKALDALWAHRPRNGPKPVMVGLVLSDLRAAHQQTLPLFAPRRPREGLNNALDTINKRYGKSTVYLGEAHAAKSHAPMRIAFTRIPDNETEG